MTELFQPLARGLGDAPALIDEAGTTSWRQLDERANRIIGALRARGVGDGATIAVMVGNRREFFEIFAAVCHASWVAVPVNWHWVGAELAYVIEPDWNVPSRSLLATHEVLHLFGADDLYEIRGVPADEANDLMNAECDGLGGTFIGETTAYAIGWTKAPPVRSFSFDGR